MPTSYATAETDQLAAALAALQSELPFVHKGKTARVPMKSGGSYSYTYADLGDVTKAIVPLLTKNGLAFSCCPRVNERGGYELAGVLLHTSGQRLEGALPVFGNQAQELGSGLTYARRYLLGCMTGVVTDDDEDAQLATQGQTTATTPPPYTGPSTDQILTELDQLGRDHGDEYAAVLAPYLARKPGTTVDDLDREPAVELFPFLEHCRRHYAALDEQARRAAAVERVGSEERGERDGGGES